MKSLMICKYFSGYKIEKNEMGVASSRFGGEERYIQGFDGGS